jgi:hypothetical protein
MAFCKEFAIVDKLDVIPQFLDADVVLSPILYLFDQNLVSIYVIFNGLANICPTPVSAGAN